MFLKVNVNSQYLISLKIVPTVGTIMFTDNSLSLSDCFFLFYSVLPYLHLFIILYFTYL